MSDGDRSHGRSGGTGTGPSADRRRFLQTAGLLGVATLSGVSDGPLAAVGTGSASGGPPRVSPADRSLGVGGRPSSDGQVLWDGTDHRLDDHWEHPDGSDPAWHEHDDYFEVAGGTGNLQSRAAIGDCHLHVEWRVPSDATGEEQSRGNSGVLMMGEYEIQVLDNYDNETYDWGWAGGKYGEAAPLVSPLRPPGEWQSYDVVWRGPRWEDGGGGTVEDDPDRPARVTVFVNGTMVLFAHRVGGSTTFSKRAGEYSQHPPELPVQLQDHDNDTFPQYRNVWVRPLADDPADPVDEPTYEADNTGTPAIVRPGRPGTVDPVSDAYTLLEDGSLDGWEAADGGPPGWAERDGHVEVVPGAGDVRTTEPVGDCQLHLEWRLPAHLGGEAAARGSGIALADRYQVHLGCPREGSADRTRYAGAYPDQAPPDVDATRGPGEWQTLDVLWLAPRFEDGEAVQSARLTALLNGVVVQERLLVDGPNRDGRVGDFEAHPVEAPVRLLDRGSRVQFRNGWYRTFDVTDGDGDYKDAPPHETALAYVDILRRELESNTT